MLKVRADNLVTRIADVRAGVAPLHVGAEAWARGTPLWGRTDVPPSDPRYAEIQRGILGALEQHLAETNRRLAALGLPRVG